MATHQENIPGVEPSRPKEPRSEPFLLRLTPSLKKRVRSYVKAQRDLSQNDLILEGIEKILAEREGQAA